MAYNAIEKIKLMDKRKKFLFIEKYKSSDFLALDFFWRNYLTIRRDAVLPSGV